MRSRQEIDNPFRLGTVGSAILEIGFGDLGPDYLSGPADMAQGFLPETYRGRWLEYKQRIDDCQRRRSRIDEVCGGAHGARGGAFRSQCERVTVDASEQALRDR